MKLKYLEFKILNSKSNNQNWFIHIGKKKDTSNNSKAKNMILSTRNGLLNPIEKKGKRALGIINPLLYNHNKY